MILSISAVTGCCVDTRFRGSMHASTVMVDNHHDVLQRQMMKPMPLTLHQLLSSVRKYSHCWQTCRVRKAFVYVTIRIVSLTLSYIASLPLSHIDCLPLLCFHLSLSPTPPLPPSLPPSLPSFLPYEATLPLRYTLYTEGFVSNEQHFVRKLH